MTGRLKYYCMRIPAALLLAAVLAGIGSCRYAREKGLFLDRELKKARSSAAMEKTVRAGTSQTDMNRAQMTQPAKPENQVNNAEYDPAEAVASNICYIIVGTFTNHANAQAAAARYKKQGYSTSLIPSVTSRGENAELVAVKSFPDRETAKAYLADFKAAVEPKAWIYPRE